VPWFSAAPGVHAQCVGGRRAEGHVRVVTQQRWLAWGFAHGASAAHTGYQPQVELAMHELLIDLLCPVCLRYLSKRGWLAPDENIRFSRRYLQAHVRACSLPYETRVSQARDPVVFVVTPRSTSKERMYSFEVAKTAWRSGDIGADKIGWYPSLDREDILEHDPRAYVPAMEGRTLGIVVVRRRLCLPYDSGFDPPQPIASEEMVRWCLERIWIHAPFRRSGVATNTVRLIASSVGVKPSDLGFLAPFTDAGFAFVKSLCGTTIYLG